MRPLYRSVRPYILPALSYGCVVGIAIAVIPWTGLPAGLGVLSVLLTALLGIFLAMLYIGSAREGRIVGTVGAWGLGLAGLFSFSALMQHSWGAFLGVDVEHGSIVSFLALGTAAVIGALAFSSPNIRKNFLSVIALSGLCTGLGYFLAAHPSLDLVRGTDWFSIYLLAGLSAIAFSALSARATRRAEFALLAACLSIAIMLTFGAADQYVPLLVACSGLLALWWGRRETSNTLKTRVLVMFFVIVALLNVFGLGRSFASAFPSSEDKEYRPSVALSLRTVSLAYAADGFAFLIGDGHGAFGRAWDANRAQPVNESPLWDEEFSVGAALIYSLLIGSGALAVIVASTLSIALSVRLFSVARQRHHQLSAEMSAAAATSLFLLVTAFLHIPSLPMMLLTFMLIAFGSAALLKEANAERMTIPLGRRYDIAVILVLCGLFGVLLLSALVRGHTLMRYLAALRADRTRVESLLSVEGPLYKALQIDAMPEGAAALSRVRQHAAQLRIESTEPSSEQVQQELRILVENAEAAAETAVNGDAQDFRYRIDLGSAFSLGYRALDDRSRLEQAEKFYRDAQDLAPRHPLPYLLRAKVLRILGREEEAITDASAALRLKSNYADAWSFLASSTAPSMRLPNGEN